jgi:hypothetical protein
MQNHFPAIIAKFKNVGGCQSHTCGHFSRVIGGKKMLTQGNNSDASQHNGFDFFQLEVHREGVAKNQLPAFHDFVKARDDVPARMQAFHIWGGMPDTLHFFEVYAAKAS